MKNKKINFLDLGIKDYEETWNFQKEILSKILKIKKENIYYILSNKIVYIVLKI